MAKAKTEPKFKVGDRVRLNAKCIPFPGVYERGQECTVLRARRDHTAGLVGVPPREEWVYEVDILHQPGRPEFGYRTFWEHLLERAD